MTEFTPHPEVPDFLSAPGQIPRDVDAACEWLQLRPEDRDALVGAAQRLSRSDPWVAQLQAVIPGLLDDRKAFDPDGIVLPGKAETPERDLFYAVALLLSLEHPRRRHRALGVPEEISRQTLQDLQRWLDDFRKKHGRPGFDNPRWLSKAWRAGIFTLGRLQFEPCPFKSVASLYDVSGSTPSPLTLVNHGVALGQDDRPLPETAKKERAAWTARLEVEDRRVRGHAVTVNGRVERCPGDWRLGPRGILLAAGHPVLSVHIPVGGRLKHSECIRSYQRARRFFKRHLPRWEWRALVCHSWLMDPRLGEVLDKQSNIVRFQQDYHKLPHPDGPQDQIWERVFGGRPDSLHNAPRDTSLQRAVLDFARAGGVWRLMTGVLLRNEIPAEDSHQTRLLQNPFR